MPYAEQPEKTEKKVADYDIICLTPAEMEMITVCHEEEVKIMMMVHELSGHLKDEQEKIWGLIHNHYPTLDHHRLTINWAEKKLYVMKIFS